MPRFLEAHGEAFRSWQQGARLIPMPEAGAFALVLLIGSGLLVRAFWKLQHVDPGFNPNGILTARLALTSQQYSDQNKLRQFWLRLNPAVTLARSFTNTFAGIRPIDAPGFIVAQLAGAFAATILFRWLVPSLPMQAADVVVPHTQKEVLHGI